MPDIWWVQEPLELDPEVPVPATHRCGRCIIPAARVVRDNFFTTGTEDRGSLFRSLAIVTHLERSVEGLSSGSVAERVRNRNFRRFTRKEEEKRRGRGLHKCLLNEISVVTRTSDPHSHMQRTSPPTSKQDAAHHYCTSS